MASDLSDFRMQKYLNDLRDYAADLLQCAIGNFDNLLFQPFSELLDPSLTGDRAQQAVTPVHQKRLVVGVLKQYVDTLLLTDEQRSTLNGEILRYRQTVYDTLLTQLGTSRQELTSTRLTSDNEPAAKADRIALADRLGVELYDAQNKDQLNLLSPPRIPAGGSAQDTLAEFLEKIFGYAKEDSRLNPPPSLNKLQDLRTARLRGLWLRQDHPEATNPDDLPLLIDPDIISKDYLRPDTDPDPMIIWQQRSDSLTATRNGLSNSGPANESDRDRLNRLLQANFTQDVWALNSADAFNQQQLDPIALTVLTRLHKVVEANADEDKPLRDSDWEDVYDILTQVQKVRQYPSWRNEEKEKRITLSGDYFQVPSDLSPQSSVSAFRSSARDQRIWQYRLQARIDQAASISEGLRGAVMSAEEATLDRVCIAYISVALGVAQEYVNVHAGPGDSVPPLEKSWLTQRLLIDVEVNSQQMTTPIEQAIETFQTLLFGGRTGHFVSMVHGDSGLPAAPVAPSPAIYTWTLLSDAITAFDQTWKWISTYALWRSAMRLFLYPENLLFPGVRPTVQLVSPVPQVNVSTGNFQLMLLKLGAKGSVTAMSVKDAFEVYRKGSDGPDGVSIPATDSRPAVLHPFNDALQVIVDLVYGTPGVNALSNIRDTVQGLAGQDANRNNYLVEGFFFVPLHLALQLQQAGQYLDALNWYRVLYDYNLRTSDNRRMYSGLALDKPVDDQGRYTRRPLQIWVTEYLNPHIIAQYSRFAYTRFVLLSLCQCLMAYADSEFSRESNDAVVRARELYLTASALLNLPGLYPQPTAKVPANPLLEALRQHAGINLKKIHQGRNIAGLRRQQSLMSQTDVRDSLTVDSNGQIIPASASALSPTPYRYATLMDRAKQLVSLAQQIEGQYLATLEKADAELYNLLRARQDLDSAESTIQLQDLKVVQANDSVKVANLQKDRAQVQSDTYTQWINAGVSPYEDQMIAAYRVAGQSRNTIASLDAAITATQFATTAASGGILGSGLGAGDGFAAAGAVLAISKVGPTTMLNDAETTAQIASIRASQEYRIQDWKLQQSLANKDVLIGAQQIGVANDQYSIATQESDIARKQADHARAAVEFLSTKFTNAELYSWMSGILGGVYAYFLQQAATMARLAENQLAFERQGNLTSFIRSDYWQVGGASTPGSANSQDRRGLTGSARLLQDIYQLDQQAFNTDTRRQNLTKTFSLAALLPYEFQHFRDTGVLPFRTALSLFDADFPGHYVRLIKRLRVSVVALIPPNQGIKATLSSSGLSRVTLGPDLFQTITIQRDPESVSFSSPLNATGLFDLDPQPELLLPFEGIGVDTSWQFEMPKAANPFDYRTVADVLLTMDYTALNSYDYRQKLIDNMPRTTTFDRAYSFRQEFSDIWYDLHNPERVDGPLKVSFTTVRDDFPPNVGDIEITNILLYLSRADGETFQLDVALSKIGTDPQAGFICRTDDTGVISTRRGNGANWVPLESSITSEPTAWSLTLDHTAADQPGVRTYFEKEKITDILFVLTCSGTLPAWPQ